MKKAVFYFLTVFSLTLAPVCTAATSDPIPNAGTSEMPERVKILLSRLEEIKNMDKSGLSKAEKKELRTELRDMKAEMQRTNNGIYLSIGAIIIIILLLILIL
jgi:hypothetical protein